MSTQPHQRLLFLPDFLNFELNVMIHSLRPQLLYLPQHCIIMVANFFLKTLSMLFDTYSPVWSVST